MGPDLSVIHTHFTGLRNRGYGHTHHNGPFRHICSQYTEGKFPHIRNVAYMTPAKALLTVLTFVIHGTITPSGYSDKHQHQYPSSRLNESMLSVVWIIQLSNTAAEGEAVTPS